MTQLPDGSLWLQSPNSMRTIDSNRIGAEVMVAPLLKSVLRPSGQNKARDGFETCPGRVPVLDYLPFVVSKSFRRMDLPRFERISPCASFARKVRNVYRVARKGN